MSKPAPIAAMSFKGTFLAGIQSGFLRDYRGRQCNAGLLQPEVRSRAEFKERRAHQRIHFEAPATVSTSKYTIAVSAKNVSERGLFLITDIRFERGSEIDVAITLPQELGLPLCGMVCCHGHVVRSNSAGGVAVQIDRLAPVPQV
jgi:hypothetical protein